MNKYFLATLIATLFSSISFAQHSEIEFGFEDPAAADPVFEIELDESTVEGIQVAEGEFNRVGPFATADSPGFITPVEADENLTVNEGDQVFVRVLDASAADSPTARGVGYVNFYSPGTPGLQNLDASSGTLDITSNVPGSSANAFSVFAGDQLVEGDAELFLAEGSDGDTLSDVPPSLLEENVTLGPGEIHNHLAFDLSGDLASTDGAVGLLLQFVVVNESTGFNFESDPFFLVFNNGLTEEVFEGEALAAFGLGESVLGDVNLDGEVNFFDISPFIDLLSAQDFQIEADADQNNALNFFDIAGFISILAGVE